jgi:hypothetical protein
MTGEQLQNLYIAFWIVFGLSGLSVAGGVIWLVLTPNRWIGDMTTDQKHALKFCIVGLIMMAVTLIGLVRVHVAIMELDHKVSYADTGGRHAGLLF